MFDRLQSMRIRSEAEVATTLLGAVLLETAVSLFSLDARVWD